MTVENIFLGRIAWVSVPALETPEYLFYVEEAKLQTASQTFQNLTSFQQIDWNQSSLGLLKLEQGGPGLHQHNTNLKQIRY